MSPPRPPAPLAQSLLGRLRGEPRWRVYGALDFAGARETLRAPCVAALLLGEDAAENRAPGAGLSAQRLTATLGVVACVPARNDPGGRKAASRDRGADELATLVEATRRRLLGWTPRPQWEPLALRRGRLLALEDGRAWWQDEYETAGWIEGRPREEERDG